MSPTFKREAKKKSEEPIPVEVDPEQAEKAKKELEALMQNGFQRKVESVKPVVPKPKVEEIPIEYTPDQVEKSKKDLEELSKTGFERHKKKVEEDIFIDPIPEVQSEELQTMKNDLEELQAVNFRKKQNGEADANKCKRKESVFIDEDFVLQPLPPSQ